LESCEFVYFSQNKRFTITQQGSRQIAQLFQYNLYISYCVFPAENLIPAAGEYFIAPPCIFFMQGSGRLFCVIFYTQTVILSPLPSISC
jgi:hypothetical protein